MALGIEMEVRVIITLQIFEVEMAVVFANFVHSGGFEEEG